MEDPDADELAVAVAHHLQDDLHILGVTDAHGLEDTALDGVEEEVGILAGSLDELVLFPLEIEVGKSAYSHGQEADQGDDNSRCQTLEDRPASGVRSTEKLGIGNRTALLSVAARARRPVAGQPAPQGGTLLD